MGKQYILAPISANPRHNNNISLMTIFCVLTWNRRIKFFQITQKILFHYHFCCYAALFAIIFLLLHGEISGFRWRYSKSSIFSNTTFFPIMSSCSSEFSVRSEMQKNIWQIQLQKSLIPKEVDRHAWRRYFLCKILREENILQ